MHNTLKWAAAVALLSVLSCSKVENLEQEAGLKRPGVFAYMSPVEEEIGPNSKATVDPDNDWQYLFEVGDRINIWSQSGTTLLYNVESATEDGHAKFSGGGFTLTDGETYYSSHPLIYSVLDTYKSLSTTYEGQIQSANNNAKHLANYMYTYASAKCENGNTSFVYKHLSSFVRLIITLPKDLTLTEVSIIAAEDDLFALNGTSDVTSGTFTPAEKSNTMTLKLDNIQVSDKVLKAFMAIAPCGAGNYVVRVKDSEGKVYTSPSISVTERLAGKAKRIETSVYEGEEVPTAKIGDVTYETIAAAVDKATEGQTIEVLKAGEYTLPNLPENVTVEGVATGVVFNHTTAGSVASVPKGATFKNVTFNFGNVNYHGFQHAGTINMEGCTLNGKLFSYGNMNFTNCTFEQSNADYHMWVYGGGTVNYTGCTFNGIGKFLNLYQEDGSAEHFVNVENSTFNSSTKNKAALNVKATNGSTLLRYVVNITNCTTNENFPEASTTTTGALVVLNGLVQVDDRTADGVDYITVTQDGQKIYPADPVHIGSNSYATIQAAFNAAQDGDVITVDAGTYNEVVNVTGGKTVTIQATAGANVTVAGINHSSNGTPSTITVKNLTVDNALQTEGWFTGTSPSINPCVGAWGGHFAFDGCTFKVSGASKYETGIMTWWVIEKTTFDFDNCVFEASDAAGSKPSSARAMQIYGDVDMTVDDCTFATAKSYSLKYVGKEGSTAVFNDNTVSNSTCFVQLGSAPYAGTGYSISLNHTTYSGEIAPYLIDNEENQTVYIDGVKVYPAVLDYETDANGNLSIYTAAGMQYFASQVNDSQVSYSGKTVTLMNNIDMTGIDWIPVGQTGGYAAKTYFQGTFDGNGKTISNLTVTHWEEGSNGGKNYASGLFGFIDAAGATVKDLTMDNANVMGSHWTGAIVGYLSGEISGCTVMNSSVVCTNKNSEANGDKAGLITGYINGTQGTVTNCTGSNSTVQAYRDAGQLVGAAKSSQVSDCTATNVTVTGTGGGNIRNEVIGRLL